MATTAKVMTIDELPGHAKVLTSTWAMKKKANGTLRAKLNVRGHEQEDEDVASSVVSNITI